MKSKMILGSALLFVIVLAGGYYFLTAEQTPGLSEHSGAEYTITLTSDGYQPRELTIQKGDTIVFSTQRNEPHWPASDIHPTHSIYPEFDSKQPIAPNETWEFRFDKVGEWPLHDHIRAYYKGIITVTE